MHNLVSAHEEMTSKVSRPVDYVSFISFNSDTLSRFFAKGRLVYIQKRTECALKIINLDETGSSPVVT